MRLAVALIGRTVLSGLVSTEFLLFIFYILNDIFGLQVFEFINHLQTTEGILPIDVLETTRNALICSKNNEYFLQKSTWMKYIGLELIK